MANILLTTQCNRSCPYCFAKREMSDSASDNLMSWENLIYIADFLKASERWRVSLLGGEPTSHPECVDFILYLLERGFDITVFTNGMLNPSRLEEFKHYLIEVRVERLTFVCNLNDPIQTPASKKEAERIQSFLSLMGPWVSPGFNIYRLDFTLDFLFDCINRFGMKRHLRLGITHPIPGKRNGFIRTEDIGQVIKRLYSYRHLFDTFRVSPGLDCGFPICKFNDEELGWLHRFRGSFQFTCGPAVDISPDMSVYYCFPLSNYHRKSLFEFDSMRQIDDYFLQLRDQIKTEIPGIYNECDGCRHKEDGICSGGGLCQVLNRFIDEAPVRIPEIEHELAKNRLPK
ncbi:MAG: radical SAM protein [Thermodesulfobacteriota bacterium]